MTTKIFAGNSGPKVKSDCKITLEITKSGGISIELNSKVGIYFGDSIIKICKDMLKYFGIDNAKMIIDDSAAMDFVLQARIEAAVKQCIDTDLEYLPEMLDENRYSTLKDKNRRSRLYLPGNTPKIMTNAGLHSADGIILDLEDSVAPDKKDEARILVRNALRSVDFYGAERMVRINQVPKGLDDLDYIIPHNVNLVLVPKCESADQINTVNSRINKLLEKYDIKNPVYLMPIIESSLGVIKAYEIASAADNVVALAIGLEDYTADLGVERTETGSESLFARNMVANAAKAAKIQAIDSVFSDVANMEKLRKTALESKSIGFVGMGCIHPRQVSVIHDAFAPTQKEIEKAKTIVSAFIKAEEQGLGVVALGSKMIDPPVVKRAQKIVDIAIETGKLDKNWRNDYVR